MKVEIVTPESIYDPIRECLFPAGNSDEHFGFALAGMIRCYGLCRLLVRMFIPADQSCLIRQSPVCVRPDPRFTQYVWVLAKRSNSCLIHMHTHPFSDTHVTFSPVDDASDRESFPQAEAYLDHGPQASIVFGKNSLDARWYNPITGYFEPVTEVRVIGEHLVTITPTSARKQVLCQGARGDENEQI
jgi:hypothetical protein